MDQETTGYYVAFSHFMGIGPHKFAGLVSYFKDLKAAYHADEKVLSRLMGAMTALRFFEFRNRFNINEKLAEIRQKNILILTRQDPGYPKQLLNLTDPPICLYAKGDPETVNFETKRFFAIVGTRAPTSYGLYVSHLFGSQLAEHFVIVSGMAMGIDYSAHRAALDAGGKTVAFLGCGVDLPYPRENIPMYERIIGGGGMVMSDYPPGMTTLKGLFVARNRLISGLSEGVLVIEGAKHSGTLITARYAADQGKDVFAPPAPINSDKSVAPNTLLQNGAKLVLSPSDILQEYGYKASAQSGPTIQLDNFAEDEKKILILLLNESRRIDDIIIASGLTPTKAMNLLTILEVKGTVIKNADGTYGMYNKSL